MLLSTLVVPLVFAASAFATPAIAAAPSTITEHKTVTAAPAGTTTLTLTSSSSTTSSAGIPIITIIDSTTVLAIVTAVNMSSQAWTSTIVISGQGTHTDPIATANTTVASTHCNDTSMPTTSTTPTSLAPSTLFTLPPGLGPTSLGSAALSSLRSSMFNSIKSTHHMTTAAPTKTTTSTSALQSTTVMLGSSEATTLDHEMWNYCARWLLVWLLASDWLSSCDGDGQPQAKAAPALSQVVATPTIRPSTQPITSTSNSTQHPEHAGSGSRASNSCELTQLKGDVDTPKYKS